MTKHFKNDSGIVYAVDVGQEHIIKAGWVELTNEELDAHINPPKSAEQLISEYEAAIEIHINVVSASKGYNTIDSIAKYLGSDNVFKAECVALSAWVADVWVSVQSTLNSWQNGDIDQPSIEDVITGLPAAPVKGVDYN